MSDRLADWPRVSYEGYDFPPLQSFSCGDSEPWEHEVNGIFRGVHRSNIESLAVRAATHGVQGEFVGAYLYHQIALEPPGAPPIAGESVYIQALAISKPWRGQRGPSGRRLGDFLLEDALSEIESVWEEMPRIWALVQKANRPSQRMVWCRGFERVPAQGLYDMWLRNPALDPSWIREPVGAEEPWADD